MLSSKTTSRDMNLIREVLWDRMHSASGLPIAYRIGDTEYKGIPDSFHPTRTRRIVDANITEVVYSAKVPDTPLSIRVEVFEYKDSAVYEWTVWFTNEGEENSPVISDFYGCVLPLNVDGSALLYHNNGDYCNRAGLETTTTALDECGASFGAEPVNGRSCDRAWPYYRLMSEGFGYNIAIGWPGVWQSRFVREGDKVLFTSKQKFTNYYLKPGETARSPRTVLMAFEGDEDRGVNVWRRFYFAHVIPRTRGDIIQPKTCFSHGGGGEEFTLACEENQIAAISKLIERGQTPDIWWIDAGWYPCKDENGVKRWVRTGKWYPDPEKWPNGLGPVGEFCDKNNIQLLLWFEPERVSLKYWPEENPDEYVLKLKTPMNNDFLDNQGLLYLGNPECREWLTNLVKGVLSDGHVKIYRQDFNGDPFPMNWWLQNDEGPDRAGITENLHVQGYLQFWDDLLFDVADLWIDSCASGGRRNDIEAMRRAVALHPTDYGYGEHPVKEAFQKTWFEWTPYFRSIASSWDDEDGEYGKGKPHAHGFDSYCGHVALAPCSTFGAGAYADDAQFERSAKFRELWKKAAPYTLETNFYCLTPVRKSSEDWFSIQFVREEDKTGILQVIRNTKCEQESLTVFPKEFEDGLTYLFDSPEYGRSFEITGREINETGITFSLPKRSGEIWFFSVKD